MNDLLLTFLLSISIADCLGNTDILTNLYLRNAWDFQLWKNKEVSAYQSVPSVTVLIQTTDRERKKKKRGMVASHSLSKDQHL